MFLQQPTRIFMRNNAMTRSLVVMGKFNERVTLLSSGSLMEEQQVGGRWLQERVEEHGRGWHVGMMKHVMPMRWDGGGIGTTRQHIRNISTQVDMVQPSSTTTMTEKALIPPRTPTTTTTTIITPPPTIISSPPSQTATPPPPPPPPTAVKRATRRVITAPIKLTDTAAQRIRHLLDNRPDAVGVRLGVRTRGCNGMSYTLDYLSANDPKKVGEESVDSHGVHIVIDPKALIHLIGTTMDYKDDALSSEFVFNNPNAKGSCGCGESFNV